MSELKSYLKIKSAIRASSANDKIATIVHKGDKDKYISLQIDLIKQSLTWLDEGGILIYAVCSLQKKEGEEQIKSILQTENSVELLPIEPSEVLAFSQAITKEGWLRIFPNFLSPFGGNDGFFICRLQKK